MLADKTTKIKPDDFPVASEPHLRGTIRLDEHTVMLAARHGSVYRYKDNGQVMPIVRYNTPGIDCGLASGRDGHAYLLAHRGQPQACTLCRRRLNTDPVATSPRGQDSADVDNTGRQRAIRLLSRSLTFIAQLKAAPAEEHRDSRDNAWVRLPSVDLGFP